MPLARRHRRLIMVGAGLTGLGVAAALTLTALRDTVVFFIPPSEIAAKAVPGRNFRLGGLVESGSLVKSSEAGAPTSAFRVTDGKTRRACHLSGPAA